ncbi:MAG TPA: alpha-glucoside ABC transporter permease [Rhodobacteraceae bacterium]|jgi:alpha-glucoside transport system permease protein|nr:alpha-glucoside ABC transporter permease [Paracoccaceae bacterium]|tara:strand:+ start:6839 stop:7996 length:1158 start_codon:yes stop_codon:yes gene_type:complete
MDGIVKNNSSLSKWIVHITVALLVTVWVAPTLGLFVSSLRTNAQISVSPWWLSVFPLNINEIQRAADPDEFRKADGDVFIVSGNLFGEESAKEIIVWGTSSRAIDAYVPGDMADLGDGESITVQANGDYVWRGNDEQLSGRGQRVLVTTRGPPEFTFENYRWMLFAKENTEGVAKAFINTLTVAIPSTIIPIALAAFAAYALAWMKFRGNALLITAVVVGLALPPQIILIPILKLHLSIGIGKSYLGMWLVHSAFTLPFAIFLLHNYMAGIPREIIENARLDGATDFQIFIKIILPLCTPALASWAIIQFLWTYNDLLGPMVFLQNNTGDNLVLTQKLTKLFGMYSERWDLIATSTFISMAVPLVVFLLMQRHFARGLLAGSIKG